MQRGIKREAVVSGAEQDERQCNLWGTECSTVANPNAEPGDRNLVFAYECMFVCFSFWAGNFNFIFTCLALVVFES